jgi:hypothetical protein
VVVGRGEVAEEIGRERQALALDRAVVLDGDRHAGERPLVAGADVVGGGQRLIGEDVHEGVEAGVELVDAVQRGLHQLTGGQLAVADEPGELVDGAEQEIGGLGLGHDAEPSAARQRAGLTSKRATIWLCARPSPRRLP